MSHPLSKRFQLFADSECKDSSALYYVLSHSVAQDEALLEIAGQASPTQPAPNLFFAAVHYLLAADSSHSLATFYPTCTRSPGDPSEAYPHFQDFVVSHREEIVALLQSRLVQTNEVGRSAYLFPALSFAASHFKGKPLALVEIGTSAGLNLLWDRYRYSYGTATTYGDSSSAVLIRSSFRGVVPAILSAPLPRVSHRIGIDVNVVDAADPSQAAWLRALIWPEHHERSSLLDAALQQRNELELDLRAGDGFAMLADLAEEISEESLLCVYHTHVANQVSSETQQRFLKSIEELGAKRDLLHVFNNIQPNLHLTAYCQGRLIDMPLAKTDGHARWIEWLQK